MRLWTAVIVPAGCCSKSRDGEKMAECVAAALRAPDQVLLITCFAFSAPKEGNMRGTRFAALVGASLSLGLVLDAGPAAAGKDFDAEDAAWVDWSWKHCETTSTAKEHKLADAANEKGGDKLHAKYVQELHKIADVQRTPDQIARLCTTIQDRYGPSGDLIPNLVSARGEKPGAEADVETKPAAAAEPQKQHSGRHHRGSPAGGAP
jgi:hypothetical protein